MGKLTGSKIATLTTHSESQVAILNQNSKWIFVFPAPFNRKGAKEH